MVQDEEAKTRADMKVKHWQYITAGIAIVAVFLLILHFARGTIVIGSKALVGIAFVVGAFVFVWAFYTKSKYKTATEVIKDICAIEDRNGIELDCAITPQVVRISDTEALAYFPSENTTYGYSYLFGIHSKAKESLARAQQRIWKYRLLDRIEIPKEIGERIIEREVEKEGFVERK